MYNCINKYQQSIIVNIFAIVVSIIRRDVVKKFRLIVIILAT